MKKLTSTTKRAISIVLVFCSLFCLCIHANAASLPKNTSNTEDKYDGNWIYWSQGASKYWGMRDYGCRMVAQSKLLMEMGIAEGAEFDPDAYFDWCAGNGYVDRNSMRELHCGQGPGAYAATLGKDLSYKGQIGLSGSRDSKASQVMSYINKGYYVILGCGAHHAYVGREASIKAGTPVIYDSWSGYSYNDAVIQKYTSYSLKNFAYFWIFSRDKNIPAAVITGNADDITKTGATLHGSFTTTGASASECGMYIGRSASVMTKLGSDKVNTYGTSMFYNTGKYGYALTAGTTYYYQAYAIVDGRTFWGDVKSFTTAVATVSTTTRTATVVNTNGQYLAIKDAPAASPKYSTQIGRIPPGGTVTVDASKTSGSWYWVTCNGVSGYAYGKYLSLN